MFFNSCVGSQCESALQSRTATWGSPCTAFVCFETRFCVVCDRGAQAAHQVIMGGAPRGIRQNVDLRRQHTSTGSLASSCEVDAPRPLRLKIHGIWGRIVSAMTILMSGAHPRVCIRVAPCSALTVRVRGNLVPGIARALGGGGERRTSSSDLPSCAENSRGIRQKPVASPLPLNHGAARSRGRGVLACGLLRCGTVPSLVRAMYLQATNGKVARLCKNQGSANDRSSLTVFEARL